jgi:hypothetical protein
MHGGKKIHTKFELETPKGKNQLESVGIDRTTILKCILNNKNASVGNGFI